MARCSSNMTSSSPKKRIAIIGSGIAGLACAYELQRAGNDVTVFEKSDHVGGRMSSRTKGGFIFDTGADHLCNLYDQTKNYCQEFGIGWEKMRFLSYGASKGGHVIPLAEAIGRFSQFRLALQYLLTKSVGDFFDLSQLASDDTENAYDYMRRHVGQEVADYFVDAFTSTYQFHRAKEISVGALFGIMQSISKNKKKWDLHRTPGGMQALPHAFASRLTVRLNAPVDRIVGGSSVQVGSEQFDAAVIASTANVTSKIYQNPTDKQRKMLAAAKYATTVSVAFRVDRKKLPDVAVVWVPYVESSKISGFVNEAMKGEELVHDGSSIISTWLHEEFAKTIIDKTDDEIYALVKTELLRVCPWVTSVDQLQNHDLQRWPAAMPKFYPGYLSTVSQFLTDGQGDQNVFFCGDYLNAPWIEGSIRGGQRVAKQVLAAS